MQRLLVDLVAGDAMPERRQQIADRALDRRAAGLALVVAELLEPGDQRLDLVGLLREMGAALVGRGERLARPLAPALLAPSPFFSFILIYLN